ncbi:MAG: GAF and ANTAR domain-containing protein [Actinomycetota bacterium]|nr:GAF and ANTAR domain-containing protein [Actinomycetota bacterium]
MSDYADAVNEGLTALSTFVVGRSTLGETLDRVAGLACQTVPGTDMVGLTMLRDGKPATAVFTDPLSPEIDQTQYDTGTGPCLDAFRHGRVYRIESTSTDEHWPEFSRAAGAKGIRSTLSLPLMVEDQAVGALNLYSRAEASFGDEQARVGMAFASQAAVAMANAQAYWEAKEVADQLGEAMKSRAVIEQAKGILMAAQGCTADEAFDLLVKASQRSNRKLRDIAVDMVDNPRRRRIEPPPATAS